MLISAAPLSDGHSTVRALDVNIHDRSETDMSAGLLLAALQNAPTGVKLADKAILYAVRAHLLSCPVKDVDTGARFLVIQG